MSNFNNFNIDSYKKSPSRNLVEINMVENNFPLNISNYNLWTSGAVLAVEKKIVNK